MLAAPDKQRFDWVSLAPASGPATLYDVVRGTVAALPVGGAGESCFADGRGPAFVADGAIPPPGTGWTYLVRGVNTCAVGSYGFATSGAERISGVCP